MTMMKVIRDATGKVINIGDWDYCYADAVPGEPPAITNPLPDGATEQQENVITGWDGGLYVEFDPRAEAP